jgi:hypothetical protein
MPCYIRAANRLGVSIPQKTDPIRLEENLMRELKVTANSHEKLAEAINKKLAEDPEELKKILVQAIAISAKKEAKKEEGKTPPDRLRNLVPQGNKVLVRVAEESPQE